MRSKAPTNQQAATGHTAYIVNEHRKHSFGLATDIVEVFLDPVLARRSLDHSDARRTILSAPLNTRSSI